MIRYCGQYHVSLLVAPKPIGFRRAPLPANVLDPSRGIAGKKASLKAPSEKKRKDSLNVVTEAPPLAFGGLVPDAYNKRAIEARQCRAGDRAQIIENFLVVESRLRGEVLKGRRAPVIANQQAERSRRVDRSLRAGKRGNPRALGKKFG